MARRYFTLLAREGAGKPWSIEFGAYDRADVADEFDDYRDHGVKAGNLKIITTGGKQAEIAAYVRNLNTLAGA